ncbi:hypothetical protein FQN60_007070 [Etheostoma spectabile]|uniref:Uncharacterized protein n=1 Tax=Etheostoma spectabile TaxID=54343 RepID=A0A5J5CAR3_9PERO|nr:hypothetical protein FQN60_007070 [Etheostoma spectabile]
MWWEVNPRVNYPLKTALVELGDQEEVNIEDKTSTYYVSNQRHASWLGLASQKSQRHGMHTGSQGIPKNWLKKAVLQKFPWTFCLLVLLQLTCISRKWDPC